MKKKRERKSFRKWKSETGNKEERREYKMLRQNKRGGHIEERKIARIRSNKSGSTRIKKRN